MIFLRNYFVNTTKELDILTVIHETNRAISEAGVKDGLLTIIIPAPGGAVTVLEPLPDVVKGLKEAISIFAGRDEITKNRRKEEVDIAPRVAAAMIGKSVSIPIKEGRLLLEPREEPVLIDMDRRGLRREFFVHIITIGPDDVKVAARVPPKTRK